MEFRDAIPVNVKFQCTRNCDPDTKLRAVREDADTVFVYGPRRKNRGWRMENAEFYDKYTPVECRIKDENADWHKRIKRAIKCLESSGLWPEYLEILKNLDLMTWHDHKDIYALYWEDRDYTSPEWTSWFETYPFLKRVSDDGSVIQTNTWYLFEASQVRLKSMYFGGRNAETKAHIAAAIAEKRDCRITARTSYDVTFNMNSDKAWYAEEYKDCGNGHYYLAIDHNTAWFMEDD